MFLVYTRATSTGNSSAILQMSSPLMRFSISISGKNPVIPYQGHLALSNKTTSYGLHRLKSISGPNRPSSMKGLSQTRNGEG